jgi:uncharacterized protein
MRTLATMLMLAVASPAAAQEEPAPSAPHLAVSGEGRVAQAPDLAHLRIGVVAEADGPEAAAEALAARIAPVVDALLAADVAAADIQTGTLDLRPVHADAPAGPQAGPEITGYRAESLLSLEIRRLDAVGRIVGAAIAAGANRLDGIAFALSDPQAARDAALARAVADATRKAALVADAAGRGLGPVLSVIEAGGGTPLPMMMMQMEARASGADIAVARGEIEVTAAVRMIFGLADP